MEPWLRGESARRRLVPYGLLLQEPAQVWGPFLSQVQASLWELDSELQAQQENPVRRFWRLPERVLLQVQGMPGEPLPQEQAWEPALLRE